MTNRKLILIICFAVIFFTPISMGVGMIFASISNDGAMEHVTPYVPNPTPIHWEHYDDAQDAYVKECINLGITYDEYKASMSDGSMRLSTWFDPPGLHLVDPDNKYVKMVTEHILEVTEGYCELSRITAALNFVQTSVEYGYDDELYGGNFTARPMETLFLQKGDCEDTSVLLMSIYLAMGYDAALFSYTGHVAVGVMYEEKWLLCETTLDMCMLPSESIRHHGEMPDIYRPGSISNTVLAINDGIGWYRNLIHDILGL